MILHVSLLFKWVSCRPHRVESFFLIISGSFCLLTGVFRALTFEVIIYKVGFVSVTLLLFLFITLILCSIFVFQTFSTFCDFNWAFKTSLLTSFLSILKSPLSMVYVPCLLVLLQSSPTLCDPMDCSPPGSSVYGILRQEDWSWVAIFYSRGSSWLRDWTHVSSVSYIGRRVLYH